jgi:hypothetical protein
MLASDGQGYKHAKASKGDSVRKVLLGVAITAGLLGPAALPADAKKKVDNKAACRAGDQAACKSLAYERCLAKAKKKDQPASICDSARP